MLDCNNSLQIGGEDTNITFEDQQQINTFARKTARMQELQDEIDAKKVCKKAQHKKRGSISWKLWSNAPWFTIMIFTFCNLPERASLSYSWFATT